MIKAVLFDMDGTLLDTERICLKAWQYVIDKYNLPFDISLPIESIGLNYKSMTELFYKRLGNDFPFEKYWAKSKEYLEEYESVNGVPVKEGFDRLCEYLKANHIKMIVSTSTHHKPAMEVLDKAGILPYFDGIIGGDEITNGKPAPEIFLKAADLSGCNYDECLVVEDSENGVKSAVAAELKCVYIKDIKDIDYSLKRIVHASCNDLSEVVNVISALDD